MNDFDVASADMLDELFGSFGEAATVQRGTDAAVAVIVFIERGVEKYGDYGQVVARVTNASFRNSEWQPQQGDVLTLASGARTVDAVEADDGFVTMAVLRA